MHVHYCKLWYCRTTRARHYLLIPRTQNEAAQLSGLRPSSKRTSRAFRRREYFWGLLAVHALAFVFYLFLLSRDAKRVKLDTKVH